MITKSTDFPGTAGGAQTSNGGSADAFVSKLSGDLRLISPPPTTGVPEFGMPTTLVSAIALLGLSLLLFKTRRRVLKSSP